jgi:hypothetical protein
MKISALLLSTLLIFSSAVFAECGIGNSGEIDAESSEICKENTTINIQKKIRINDIVASFSLEGDEAHALAVEEYTNGTHKESNAIISLAKKPFYLFIWQALEIFVFFAAIYCIYQIIISDEKKLQYIGTYIAGFLVCVILNLESYSVNNESETSKLGETLLTELVVKAEKISLLSIRKFISVVEKHKVNKEEYELKISKSFDTQRANTLRLLQNYVIMRQTDKAYIYIDTLDNSKNPMEIYYDANSFLTFNTYSIDFSRRSPTNELHHLYTLKPIQLDTVDFSKYGKVMNKININQFITSDITQVPEKIQALKDKLYSVYVEDTDNDQQRINNILTDFGIILRNETRKKYIYDTWNKLEKAYQLTLTYTCTNKGDIVQSTLFIRTNGKQGLSECLYMEGGQVVNPIAKITGIDYETKTESAEQKKTREELTKLIDEISLTNTQIENSLMDLSLTSLSFNDTSYYAEKIAKGGLLDFITYNELHITKTLFQSLVSTSIINNDVYIPVKNTGKFAVDMETLSKDNLNMVRKELDFTKTYNTILSDLKTTDTSSNSQKSIQAITQSFYEANGNANKIDLFKSLMNNPTQTLLAKLGIKKDCYADCEIYSALPSYAIKQTSSELLISAIKMQTAAAGLFALEGAVNKISAEKQKNKGNAAEIRNEAKTKKGTALNLSSIAGMIATAITALAVIPELIGFLGSIVLPVLDKAPYYISFINYNIFISLSPILALLITLSVVAMKKPGLQEYLNAVKSLLAIVFIILFEQVIIFLVMIFIMGFKETAYWSLAFLYNTTGFGTGIIEGTIIYCVMLVLILTMASVFAVIGVKAAQFAYEALGITPVHNTNAGNVNDKWNNVIAKTLPAIFLLSETIKSFAKNKRTNNEANN